MRDALRNLEGTGITILIRIKDANHREGFDMNLAYVIHHNVVTEKEVIQIAKTLCKFSKMPSMMIL